MNTPNSAARNQMTEIERKAYDWGFEDGRESERARIIKKIEDWIPMFKAAEPNSAVSREPLEEMLNLIKEEHWDI